MPFFKDITEEIGDQELFKKKKDKRHQNWSQNEHL